MQSNYLIGSRGSLFLILGRRQMRPGHLLHQFRRPDDIGRRQPRVVACAKSQWVRHPEVTQRHQPPGRDLVAQLLDGQGAVRMGQHRVPRDVAQAQRVALQAQPRRRDPDLRELAKVHAARDLPPERPALRRQVQPRLKSDGERLAERSTVSSTSMAGNRSLRARRNGPSQLCTIISGTPRRSAPSNR